MRFSILRFLGTVGGVALAVTVAACSMSNDAAPPANPVPSPTATPLLPAPVVPSSAPYTATQTTIISQPTPAAGSTAAPLVLAAPTPAGASSATSVTAQVSLPLGNATIPANTAIVQVATNSIAGLGASVPALARGRHVLDTGEGGAGAAILFDQIEFSQTVILCCQPSFTFTLPATYQNLTGVQYWVGLYDPQHPFVGWQLGFEGPGVVSGSTVTFTGANTSFGFLANEPLYFAFYALAQAAAAPTPAPATSAAPTPAPIAASPANVNFTSLADAPQTVTISDASTSYTGAYSASIDNSAVASVTVSTKTVTISPVGVGQAAVTVSTTDGRSIIIPVGVTTTATKVQ